MSAYWKRFSILAFLGLVISGYLLFHFTEVSRGFQEEKSFCTINESVDCDAIAKSEFSVFLNIPVAGWALSYYLILLVLVPVLTRKEAPEGRAANVLLLYTFLSIPPTLGLLGVSTFLIGKYCLMCLLLDVTNILLFLVAFYCPARVEPFGASLASGLKSFIPLWLGRHAMMLWVMAFAGILLSLMAPEALVRHYFQPRRALHADLQYLAPFLDDWRKEPVYTVPINRDGPQLERDFVIGSPTAPVTIVEFSDFECPFCKKTAEYLKPFILKRQQDFQFVFKNYPLDQSCNRIIKTRKHEYACKAARMARCAGLESDEKFWKMHDALVGMSTFTETGLVNLITETGVQLEPFGACMADPASLDRVRSDIEAGVGVKVMSTPTILVNGRKLMVSPQFLPGVLDLVLKETKASASAAQGK